MRSMCRARDRINLYPAAPIRLATMLRAWTITEQGMELSSTDFEHVVKHSVYMTHVGDFEAIYEIMGRYFPGPVASTGVLTGLVPPSARLEVEVTAVIPDAG